MRRIAFKAGIFVILLRQDGFESGCLETKFSLKKELSRNPSKSSGQLFPIKLLSISFPICGQIKLMVIIITLVWNAIHYANQHKQLIKILAFSKKNVGWFLLKRFVELLRVCSLHIFSRNHFNTFWLINLQKT